MSTKEHRLNTLYKIIDKTPALIPFKLNRAQAHFLKHRSNRNIICKSRQLGFTTFAAIDSLDTALFNPNIFSLIISCDKDSSQVIFEKVALAWEHFKSPTDSVNLKELYSVDTDSKNRLKFGFGDGTYSSVLVKGSGRGTTTNKLHVSEYAKLCAKFPKKALEMLTGTIQAVPPEGEATIESTAEGNTGLFHSMFWKAWNRPDNQKPKAKEFKAFFYNWQWDDVELAKIKEVDPDIPQKFRDIQFKHNNKCLLYPDKYQIMDDIQLTHYYHLWLGVDENWDLLNQEYPLYPEDAFLGSGNALFDRIIVQKYIDASIDPIKIINRDWKIYEEAKVGHTYGMGVDVSEGVGKDHSAIVVLDLTPKLKIPKVVATYANNQISPDELAYEIKFAGDMYYFPLAAVERNNHGHSTLNTLKRIYPEDKIYKEIKDSKFDEEETEKLGFHMHVTSKPTVFNNLKSAVNLGAIDIPSLELNHEILIYDRQELNKTKNDPDATNHFDLITALAIAFHTRLSVEEDLGEVKTYSPHSNSQEDIHKGV